MTKEETTATWQCWLLDAIHKIRYQKQRPNVQRVAACIRMHHPQYSDEAVEEHLEQCVGNGSIAKVVNKGLTSYRDPGSAPGRGQRTLHITDDMDLTKVRKEFFVYLSIIFLVKTKLIIAEQYKTASF